jgi:hypothetical protein
MIVVQPGGGTVQHALNGVNSIDGRADRLQIT